MPIQVRRLGKWAEKDRPYKWDKPSIGILTSPIGVQKIEQKWANFPIKTNAWMLRGKNVWKKVEIGRVNEDFLFKLGLKIVDNPQKPDELNIDEDAINIIFTQNVAGERVPFTAGIIAHRLGHAVAKYNPEYREFTETVQNKAGKILREFFGIELSIATYDLNQESMNILKRFYEEIGTMRSARNHKLRAHFEFPHELIAQYILTGGVKFNPLPRKILSHYVFGRSQFRYKHFGATEEDYERLNQELQEFANDLNRIIKNLLEDSVGGIFAM